MTNTPNDSYNDPVDNGAGEFSDAAGTHASAATAEPVKKKRNPALIAGGSVLALAILTGGGFLAANAVNALGDKDIAVAVPSSSAFYAELDLNPANDQKIAALNLINKIEDLSESEKTDANKDLGEIVTDPFFEGLDYESEVKPWLGDKVALSAWQQEKSSDDPVAVAVYEVKDEGKAKTALESLKSEDGVGVIRDGYLIIAEDAEKLADYEAKISAGKLADVENYKADRKLISENTVAVSWVDFGNIDTDELAAEALSGAGLEDSASKEEPLEGRLVTSLSLANNGATVNGKVVGLKGAGIDPEKQIETAKGLSDIENLPAGTDAAFSVNGLGDGLKQVWEENADTIADTPELADVEEQLAALGIDIPEDFPKIFGSETSLGVSLDGASEPSVEYRAKGGDGAFIAKFLKDSGVDSYGIVAHDDNEVATITYGEEGEGKLGADEKFKSVMDGIGSANSAAYLDIDGLYEYSESMNSMYGEESDTKEKKSYGQLGLTSSFDKEKNISDIKIKWVY